MNKQGKYEDQHEGLRERVAKKVGAQLEKMAMNANGCWSWGIYEPEVPPEIVEEMTDYQ